MPVHLPTIYDKVLSRWYSLAGRRGSRKASDDEDKVIEGEVQVTLTFMVQSQSTPSEQTVAPSSGFERQRSLSFRSLASRVGKQFISNIMYYFSNIHVKIYEITPYLGCPKLF